MVHSLYLNIGEGSEDEIFTRQIKFRVEHCVKMSAPDSLYSGRYDSSKSGFEPIPGFFLKHDYEGPNEILQDVPDRA